MRQRLPLRTVLVVFVAGCITVACILYLLYKDNNNSNVKSNGRQPAKLSAEFPQLAAGGADSRNYDAYRLRYQHEPRPQQEVILSASEAIGSDGSSVRFAPELQGEAGPAVLTDETGTVHWEVNVPETGLYHIAIRYMQLPGKGLDIGRVLYIDGVSPFKEASQLVFRRIWGNEQAQSQDELGNDRFILQIEQPLWQEVLIEHEQGRFEEPYAFYFTAGKHTLSLEATREPMAIDYVKLLQANPILPYSEVEQQYAALALPQPVGQGKVRVLKVQGENAVYKSNQVLYPVADRSSPAVEPYSLTKQRNNTIGGFTWSGLGQWLEWEIDVPEDGLYQIGIKYNQSFKRGITSYRKLTIDGKAPFQEMNSIGFDFHTGWQLNVLGGNDHPYQFYLEKGKHRIRLQATYGQMAPIIRAVESSILELNHLYRRIIMVTGSVPDENRDYQLELKIADLQPILRRQSELLSEIVTNVELQTGGKSDMTASLNRLAFQLSDMEKRPGTVASRLNTFKANISALGDWIYSIGMMPLQIDYIVLADAAEPLPVYIESKVKQWQHQAGLFLHSFFAGDNQLQVTPKGQDGRKLKVWLTTGLDQGKIMKRMIEDTFTPQTGITVDLQVVTPTVLQQATLAGEGPDVALPVPGEMPINFAMRNAVQDLSVIPGFEQVKSRFHESAFVPYLFQGKYYGLPVGQSFPVMFYRKDILEELDIPIPQTWDDVYEVLIELQKNHLQFGFPRQLSPNPIFSTLLLQAGGQFYRDEGKVSDLDSEMAIKAFQQWTELYTDYSVPLTIDFVNRFRTGEIPIGIDNYTSFNMINVIAPELKGLWGITVIPGTANAEGTIRRDVPGTGSAAIMLANSKDKESAWEFLDWWSNEEQQVTYGREVEAVLGPIARYDTANINALSKLPWETKEYRTLVAQWESVQGIPEVPGGYFTGRHLENAFLKVALSSKSTTREVLQYYVRFINEEMAIKRKEFGLPQ